MRYTNLPTWTDNVVTSVCACFKRFSPPLCKSCEKTATASAIQFAHLATQTSHQGVCVNGCFYTPPSKLLKNRTFVVQKHSNLLVAEGPSERHTSLSTKRKQTQRHRPAPAGDAGDFPSSGFLTEYLDVTLTQQFVAKALTGTPVPGPICSLCWRWYLLGSLRGIATRQTAVTSRTAADATAGWTACSASLRKVPTPAQGSAKKGPTFLKDSTAIRVNTSELPPRPAFFSKQIICFFFCLNVSRDSYLCRIFQFVLTCYFILFIFEKNSGFFVEKISFDHGNI